MSRLRLLLISRTRLAARRIALRAPHAAAAAAILTALATAAPAAAAGRTEQIIESASPQTEVIASVVTIDAPLPAATPAHPAACDTLQYERFRPRTGPADATHADAVVVLMPGVLEGATAFDPLARNTILAAEEQGRHIEVWAVDRRSNCLEDHTGVNAAERSGDLQEMVDYEYGGKAIDGRTFAGFAGALRSPVLPELGLAQTVLDYHAVLTTELPDQEWREQHVICGGHSLGGPIMRAFAQWDFDGNSATTSDAGYRQCAGFFGLETRLGGTLLGGVQATSVDALGGALLGAMQNTSIAAMRRGQIPGAFDAFGVGPETAALIEGLGLAADRAPNEDWTSLVRQIPRSKTLDDFMHAHASPTLAQFLFGTASMRSVHYTYMAALGQAADDNGAVPGPLRASFGAFDGAPLVRNRVPNEASRFPILGQLFGRGLTLIPRPGTTALVRWRNYDQVDRSVAGAATPDFTSPDLEVTDAGEFARIIHEGPLDFTEQYFPVRLLVDTIAMEGGSQAGSLSPLVHRGAIERKPRFVVLGGQGLIAPVNLVPDPQVILPGYNHLDVLTAAARQNGGQPEPSSQALATFTLAHTPAP